ncbi:hypothetical protein T439DRAFT_309736 [Meredithblackwellia eburnea MCA 4105]
MATTQQQQQQQHSSKSRNSLENTNTPAPPTTQPLTSPTLYVTYLDRSVKARIDREVPLEEIIRQLCQSAQLAVSEPPALFALRSKEDGATLVTNDNLAQFLERGKGFILTSSPTIEAAELVDKLTSQQPSILKLATYSLRSLVKEDAFLQEFIARGGLAALQEVIRTATGNTLAYALVSMENLVTEDRGWQGLEMDFVNRIVDIIANEPLINISRPAISILRKLTLYSPIPSSHSTHTHPPPHTQEEVINTLGFPLIYSTISSSPSFLKTIVNHLSSGDTSMSSLSLSLLNTLFHSAITILKEDRFGEELEMRDCWRVVANLMESQRSGGGDLSGILQFQGLLVESLSISFHKHVQEHDWTLLDQVWIASALSSADIADGYHWRLLGFRTENPESEFQETGTLGLKALANFATGRVGEFGSIIQSQLQRPLHRRCPLAHASNAILLLLSEHFSIPTPQPPTLPQPFLFHFYDLHNLVTKFFVRVWGESGAEWKGIQGGAEEDFERVKGVTESMIRATLGGRWGEKAWFEVKHDFATADYKTVRDRQMREMEIEDDLLSKAPVRNLRGRLYRESYEFVRAQRIQCLHEGAWFKTLSPPPSVSTSNTMGRKTAIGAPTTGGKQWRFFRLAANRRTLHYLEAGERKAVRPGLEDLPEKIDVNTITDIIGGGGGSSSLHSRPYSTASSSTHGPTTIPTPASPLAFTIVTTSTTSPPIELLAPDGTTYSEWVDGLSLLRPDGNIQTKETADLVQTLTEFGVKVKLLDLSGEKVDIPLEMPVPLIPSAKNGFYYSEMI